MEKKREVANVVQLLHKIVVPPGGDQKHPKRKQQVSSTISNVRVLNVEQLFFANFCFSILCIKYIYFFFLNLADTCPFLGPLVPLFWISGDVSSGFQSQSGFCLIRIAEANVMYIPRDPPLVLQLPTSWRPAKPILHEISTIKIFFIS